jgi:transcriptional regulator GlxA family with amidase domain
VRGLVLVFAMGLAGLLGACQRAEQSPSTAQATPAASSPGAAMTAEDAALKAKLPEQLTPDNHSWVMDAILGKPKVAIKTIGILVYDGVNDLDFTGPRYVLGQSGAKTQLIGIKPGPIKTVMGVQVVPDTTIDEVQQLDILVVPGGFTGTIEAAYDRKVLDWIRAIDKSTTYTASVCTGGWILGATGLLEGKRATTNWYRREEFLKKHKAIPTHERYVHDGKYWTSAGVTAGLDMSLAILNDNWGEKFTQGVMLDMEYDPAPPIIGGTPEKTGWLVAWMMKAMYDAGVNPLIERLEKRAR